MSRLFGAHMSVAGGLEQAFPRALAVGATAVQIFTKNANRWSAPPPSAAEIAAFRSAWQQSGGAAAWNPMQRTGSPSRLASCRAIGREHSSSKPSWTACTA